MIRLITVGFYLLISTITLAQTAEEWVNIGIDKRNNGNWMAAISDFDKAIKLKPDYALAHYNRGLVNSEIEEYEEAIKDFDNALKYDEQMYIAHKARGFAYYHLKKWSHAETDFDYYLQSRPLDMETTLALAVAYFEQEKYRKARDGAHKCIIMGQELPKAYHIRGSSKLELKDTIGALNDFDRSVELKADYYPVYLSRANLYAAQDNHIKAIEDYNIYLLGMDKDAGAYANRAKVKLATKDTSGAMEDYTNSLNINATAEVYFDRGLLYLEMGSYKDAVGDFTKCIELEFAEKDLAYFNRGIAYFKLDDIKACDDWDKAGQMGLKEAVDHLSKYCM